MRWQNFLPKSKSAWVLVAANLVPLYGVAFLGWSIQHVFLTYWAETAVIGFFHIFKLAMAAGWLSAVLVPFFIIHFGGFMTGHYIFIQTFFGGSSAAMPFDPNFWHTFAVAMRGVAPAAGFFVLSHGYSFVENYLKRERTLTPRDAGTLMLDPYRRVVVMHVTLLAGGMLISLLRTPVAGVALLIVLKVALDLRAHHRQHKLLIAAARPGVLSVKISL